MSENIAIKSIIIKVGDKELAFSVEDAKELKEALDALFGKQIIKEVRDNWYYQQPVQVPASPLGGGWSYTTTAGTFQGSGPFNANTGNIVTVANCTLDGTMTVNANGVAQWKGQ